MARHAYKIDDPANNVSTTDDDFLHTQFIALVDQEGRVVKIYDALKESEINSLEGAIRKLLKK
jgi:protein SCO1/2